MWFRLEGDTRRVAGFACGRLVEDAVGTDEMSRWLELQNSMDALVWIGGGMIWWVVLAFPLLWCCPAGGWHCGLVAGAGAASPLVKVEPSCVELGAWSPGSRDRPYPFMLRWRLERWVRGDVSTPVGGARALWHR